jgi:hypothetical protein
MAQLSRYEKRLNSLPTAESGLAWSFLADLADDLDGQMSSDREEAARAMLAARFQKKLHAARELTGTTSDLEFLFR